eukprot:CAMPEP_0169322290 /NCGR_PEP_ID=MMETSP1017-20121227/9344_1 /TAXON_ID=342587 /ORGANISM="Karlodinium micrum, Strain CCMP2283" /LENGTH=167 /DNA_ID=CAMNT_0009416829 /DNA_START=111 /DNA_END=611 /DNA_ORIENTATION=+
MGSQTLERHDDLAAVPVFVDVGAASYEGPDVSHAMEIAKLWGCQRIPPVVLALEPLHSELMRTRDVVARQLARHRRCSPGSGELADIRWLEVAASNVTGASLPMRGVENQASLSVHIPSQTTSPDYSPGRDAQKESETVRLDHLLLQQGLADHRVLFVKLDTEGHDW